MKFYVYIHKKQTNGQPFYVGKGCGRRAWRETGRSQYWQRVRKKCGLIVEIYACCLTNEQAIDVEKKLIKKIGRNNLCNHTDGGEGMAGYRHSKETIEKYSQERRGRLHTEEARRKMSASGRGKKKSDEHIANVAKALKGRKFSDEHKANLSLSIKNRKINPEWGKKSGNARKRRIFCVNNNVLYDGVRDAATMLNLDSGSISRVANGIYSSTKGFVFRYE